MVKEKLSQEVINNLDWNDTARGVQAQLQVLGINITLVSVYNYAKRYGKKLQKGRGGRQSKEWYFKSLDFSTGMTELSRKTGYSRAWLYEMKERYGKK